MKNSLPFLALTLCANLAVAEPPASTATPTQKAASTLVEKQLLRPLKKAEARRSRFSRAAPVPVVRRVRVLDTVAQADARGKTFVRFAIDVHRRGAEDGAWSHDAVVGCAYLDERKVFVQSDDAYLPARSLLGEEVTAQPDVCRAAASADAQLARATQT
jgi:hypothetical protein